MYCCIYALHAYLELDKFSKYFDLVCIAQTFKVFQYRCVSKTPQGVYEEKANLYVTVITKSLTPLLPKSPEPTSIDIRYYRNILSTRTLGR